MHLLHGLLSCLSFSACVNGRDVRELDDLLSYYYQYTESLQVEEAGVTIDENINRRFFFCLGASSGRL